MKRWRRWARLRRPTLGGLVRAAATIALVGALVMAAPAVAYYDTPGMNGIASKLAKRPVKVRCLTKKEARNDFIITLGASGYVDGWTDPVTGRWYPSDYAVLAPQICRDLTLLASHRSLEGHDLYDLTWAIIVITHEAGHLRGASWSISESRTQCWALQHLRSTMRMLALPGEWHGFLFALAIDIQVNMPPEYQFTQCRGVTNG